MTHRSIVHDGARLVLVLGGARSGKSSFAERLAVESGRSVAYIATAVAGDEEMRERIQRHQEARPAGWKTIEEPVQLAEALRLGTEAADVVLVDCVTVWLSNWLLAREDVHEDDTQIKSKHYYDDIIHELKNWLSVLDAVSAKKTVLLVSNEVGLGIVPAYALGRLYRDLLGLVNQQLAARAQTVYFMIAGLGVDIKRLHNEASIEPM